MARTKRIQTILLYVILTLGALVMILPFYWMVATSLKSGPEAISVPPTWLPRNWLFSNYGQALEKAPFGRYFLNSVFVTTVTTAGELFTSILAAYAFAKLKFWGKDILFLLLLATMMVPGELMTIPNFVTLSSWKLVNTYWALIIPWFASVFSVFTLKQNIQTIPDELYYAAKTDGASDWQFLWEMVVPLSKSSIIAVMILKVIGSWNSFLWPMIVTNSAPDLRTLPVGLQAFTTEAGIQFELLMAASTLVILPMVIIYLLLQKYIIQGISRSGLKG